ADADKTDEQDRKNRGGGYGSQDLRDRLHDARKTPVEADSDAGRDSPRGRDEERRDDAQEGGGSAREEQAQFRPGDIAQHQSRFGKRPESDRRGRNRKCPEPRGRLSAFASIGRARYASFLRT